MVAEDASAVPLTSQNGPVKCNMPQPFHLKYDPAEVKPGHRDAVSARIDLEGLLEMIGKQEECIHQNLAGAATSLVKRVCAAH